MICLARRRGANPRRWASPYSVTITWTWWSVWSTWLTIGTIEEIAPPFSVYGVTNIEM
jgi:hypothetical protein